MRRGEPLFQLFSVAVQRKDQKPIHLVGTVSPDGTLELDTDVVEDLTPETSVKVYGTITCDNGTCVRRFFFNRPKEMPEMINTNDTLPISILSDTTTCTSCYDLDMRLDLKDADGDLEISRGYLIYDCRDPRCYYSKRLTCVIPGSHGYATVHYTLFGDAVQALVKVELVIDGDHDASSSYFVTGNIFGRYGGHEYISEYQKKYYQIAIFRRKPEDGLLLPVDGNSKSVVLPLSSPLSAVPMDTSFIIEADLVVKSGETEIATVHETAEFLQGIGNVNAPNPKMIVGKNAHLNVAVLWSHWGASSCY